MSSVAMWIGIGSLVIGAGTAVYGANKQAKAVKDAAATNAAATGDQNASAWTNYLMSRGISPTTAVTAGQMPTTGNYVAINQKLPWWAGVTTTPGVGGKPNTYALAQPDLGGVPGPTAAELAAMNAAKSSASSGGGRLGTVLDPLGLVTGKKPTAKSVLDPLGLFG